MAFELELRRFYYQRPFVFISTILLIYTVLQLLLSYHIIETHFSSSSAPTSIVSLSSTSSQTSAIDEVEGAASQFTSNRFEGCVPIDIAYEWGKKRFPQQRIACMVLSLYPRNKILMQFVAETYGALCDGLFFILDDSTTHAFNVSVHREANRHMYPPGSGTLHFEENQAIIDSHIPLHHLSTFHGGTVIQLNLTRPSHHTVRNTWEKVHRMYTYFYVHYLHEYDWFVRIDDDVLVSMLNLRDYLSFFDATTDTPLYLGHTLLDRWQHHNIVYNAGNLHVLNSAALARVAPVLMTLPTSSSPHVPYAHCFDFVAGNDDPHIGSCLNAVGVYPLNTLDAALRNRFMVFRYGDHFSIKREDTWYWQLRPLDMGEGNECCNEFALNDHPLIDLHTQLRWRLVFRDLSATQWNNRTYWQQRKSEYLSDARTVYKVVPPKPCTFMYNIDNTTAFKVDADFNIEAAEIPRGQRISSSSLHTTSIMQCHRCEIGNADDPFWNNEWDRTRLLYRIDESNKHKFYEIMNAFPTKLISTRFDIDPVTGKFIAEDDHEQRNTILKLQSLIDQALDPKIDKIRF